MRYGSVCSGIEAATVAWHPLGFVPAFFSEIEKFPSSVLAHHYGSNMPGEALTGNGVPNLGDMTKFQEWPDAAIDLLVGGTPCQSFSVAGLRAGLADPRGNLMLTYLAIAAKYRPRWLVWENVPGVLSSWSCPEATDDISEGQEREVDEVSDFGCLLEGFQQLGYGFAYRVLDAQFCRASGLEYAVPQRRRRVFVVGYLGDWRRAAAVLFDGQSLRGDPAPRREAGQGVASDVAPSLTASGRGIERTGDTRGQDPVVAVQTNSGDVGYCLTASAQQSLDAETETETETLVAHALRGEGFDASEDGTGRGTPLVTVQQPIVMMERGRGDGPVLETRQDGTANAILTPNGGRGGLGVGAIAFAQNQRDEVREMDVAGALAAEPGMKQQTYVAFNSREDPEVTGDRAGPLGASSPQAQAIAWSIMPQNSGKDFKARAVDVAQPIMDGGSVGGNQGGDYIQEAWAVRRLTPLECERLQGFPDGYTQVPYRNKPAADGPRYKALGNSMAVNVMRIIGERIAMVDAIKERAAA